MKDYFTRDEWLKQGTTGDPLVLAKIDNWIRWMNPIRHALGKGIVITDGVRFGYGGSQHYFRGDGATDCRVVNPARPDYNFDMRVLGALLDESEHLFRICYYPPGKLFYAGGFHIDRKVREKQLFVSHPDKVDWDYVDVYQFMAAIPE